jgi:membrane protein required for beta-lactamase induction
MLAALTEWTDALHLFLIKHLAGPRARAPDALEWWHETQRSDESPEERSIYVILVATCWSRLIFVVGIVTLPVAALVQQVDESLGHKVFWIPTLFALGFCCTGMADMFWRSLVVRAAERRHRDHPRRRVDDQTRRLMRVARVNDGALLIQFAVAVLVVWRYA